MSALGNFLLVLAWTLTVFCMFAGFRSAMTKKEPWLASASRATLAVAGCTFASTLCLAWSFYTNDYSNQYVWQYSSRDMPAVYKLTAVWGGMDGSLQFWAMCLALSAGAVALRRNLYPQKLLPGFFAAAASSTFFFLTLVVFFTNPFRALLAPVIPEDGNGLNPLLQNPYMAVHPPLLYAGFTVLVVPFAFSIAQLLCSCFPSSFLEVTRRWLLASWVMLTLGIVLGAYWAYIELGWGGFWAWDPVENASLLPWLTCTAALHSLSAEHRQKMLRLFNVWLIILSYLLTVFATFITRSGIVQSVHAFGSSDISPSFVIYMVLVFAVTVALTVYRRRALESAAQVESLVSREAVILLSGIIFLLLCAATIVGTLFPLISEIFGGAKKVVGVPYYNDFAVPLFLLIILLMAVGPELLWRFTPGAVVLRKLRAALAGASGLGVILFLNGVVGWALVSYTVCFFASLTVLKDWSAIVAAFLRDVKAGSETTLKSAFLQQRVRWGVGLVHLGVALAAFGITASMTHKIEAEFSLGEGQNKGVSDFVFSLESLVESRTANYNALAARVAVRRVGEQASFAVLSPELRHYPQRDDTTAEVALRSELVRDIYVVLAGIDNGGKLAAFKVFVNPFQIWLWIGVGLSTFGTLVALSRWRLAPIGRIADGSINCFSAAENEL